MLTKKKNPKSNILNSMDIYNQKHSPPQLKDMVRHVGENAQPEVSALSSTQI